MTQPLRVLITNHMLAGRTGTEMYVHDVAKGLLVRGHTPIVYSPRVGPLARDLALASVAVVDDLSRVALPPDIIHGQHTLESATALLHFSHTPAVYVCHDWSWENDMPPQISRIRQFVAVDATVRDRLIHREGIPETCVSVVNNGVDLQKFLPRGELPRAPRRALVFSNYMSFEQLARIRTACASRGISVDGVGANLGNVSSQPEKLIGQYDLVFAKGRCAWEALACGVAVIVCDTWGLGPLVSTQNIDFTRQRNFGRRLLQTQLSEQAVHAQLGRYDAADASQVSRRIREDCGLDKMVDRLILLYEQAISSHLAAKHASADEEQRCMARLLQSWSRCKQPPQIEVPDLRKMIQEELQAQQLPILQKLETLATRRRRGLQKLIHSLKKRLSTWRKAA
ncbi:MAG: glycosyltransferase [Pirellulaceae bacterium]